MIDLEKASREELIQLISQLLAQQHTLQERIQQLEAELQSSRRGSGPSAKLAAGEQQAERVRKQREFEQELLKVCRPHLKQQRLQSRLCKRIERFLPELFVFVADPRVPSDNNAAERSVMEVVVSRKISGGTRSAKGSEAKSILASLFGTWLLQGKNV